MFGYRILRAGLASGIVRLVEEEAATRSSTSETPSYRQPCLTAHPASTSIEPRPSRTLSLSASSGDTNPWNDRQTEPLLRFAYGSATKRGDEPITWGTLVSRSEESGVSAGKRDLGRLDPPVARRVIAALDRLLARDRRSISVTPDPTDFSLPRCDPRRRESRSSRLYPDARRANGRCLG